MDQKSKTSYSIKNEIREILQEPLACGAIFLHPDELDCQDGGKYPKLMQSGEINTGELESSWMQALAI